jgi:high-affinity nickel permease
MAIVIRLGVYLVIGFLFGLGFHLAGKILRIK